MALGTTAALLTAAGISAGAGVGQAIVGSKAAGKAADQQQASADKGLALQKQIYEEQKAGMAPYAAFGQQAIGSLGNLLGFQPAAPAVGRNASGQPLGPVTGQQPLNMSDPRVQHLAKGGSLVDMPGANPTGRAPVSGVSSYGSGSIGEAIGRGAGSAGSAFGMVKLQAPDGDVREFPPELAAKLEQQFQGQLRRV